MNKSTLDTECPEFKLVETTQEQLLTDSNIQKAHTLLNEEGDHLVGIDANGNLLVGTNYNVTRNMLSKITWVLFTDNADITKIFYCGSWYRIKPCRDNVSDADAINFIKRYFKYYQDEYQRQSHLSFEEVKDNYSNLIDANSYADYVAKHITKLNLNDINDKLLLANVEHFAQQLLARRHKTMLNNIDIVCFLDKLCFPYVLDLNVIDFKKNKATLQLLREASTTMLKVDNPTKEECPDIDYYLRRQYVAENKHDMNYVLY